MPRPSKPKLSHFTASGQAAMVDVSSKHPTRRTATASAFVELQRKASPLCPPTPKATRLKWLASPASRPPSAPPT